MSGLIRAAMCGAVVGMMGVAARASILVDDFTQSIGPSWPKVQSVSTAGGSPTTEAGLASVLGGVRGYVVNSATVGVPGVDNVTSNVFHNGTVSFFDYQSSVGASGSVGLMYGDGATNPLGLTGVSGVEIDVMSYDFADSTPLQVTVTLTEQTGPSTSVSTFGSASISGTGVQTVMVNSFSPVALAKVDAIKVDFAAPAGGDFRVDSISVTQVPEPASLGVMGVGALALLRRRR